MGSWAQAQQVSSDTIPDTFVYLDEEEKHRYLSLHADQLSALKEDSPISDIKFVRIALKALSTGGPMNLNLLEQSKIMLDVIRIDGKTSDLKGVEMGW